MEHPRAFSCDLHGGDFATRSSVSGDIGIHGHNVSVVYGDVCSPCISKLAVMIATAWPKHRPSPGLKIEKPMQSQQS